MFHFVLNENYKHYSHDDYKQLSKLFKTKKKHALTNKKIPDSLATGIKSMPNSSHVVVCLTDVFSGICKTPHARPGSAQNAQEMKKNLENLEKLPNVRIIPNIDFQYVCASKRYAQMPEFRKLMMPNTLIYPNDAELIRYLDPQTTYLVKFGFYGSKFGIREKQGNEVLQAISKKIQKSKQDPHSMLRVCEEFAIIQPKIPVFEQCYEFRFFVVNNNIISVSLLTDMRNVGASEKLFDNPTQILHLNTHIQKFVQNCAELINKNWPEYGFARIDIIAHCKSKGDKILVTNIKPDFIYLNEIEPLGSGLKAYVGIEINPKTFGMTWSGLKLNNVVYQQLYKYIVTTAATDMPKDAYKYKYTKYKTKYLQLLNQK